MTRFMVKGVRANGTEGSWRISADDEEQALEKAKSQGIYPTEVKMQIGSNKPTKIKTPGPLRTKKRGIVLLLVGIGLSVLSLNQLAKGGAVLEEKREVERSLASAERSMNHELENGTRTIDERLNRAGPYASKVATLVAKRDNLKNNPPHLIPGWVCIFIGAIGVGFLSLGILFMNPNMKII